MGADGSSWLPWCGACLCFASLSFFAWIVYVFVVQKRNTAAEPAITASADVGSQGTGVQNINASSSSSISGQLGHEYDVFLSFHGEDTRKGFADSLYTVLEGAGIRVFRDNERLGVGKEIGPELLHGIKQSSISIPIFSENYASSKWCLKEFAFMMECREARKQIVFPVFYDVTPNEVQHQTGSYARAFRQHVNKQDPEIVRTWRKALAEVGSLKGWELKNEANGHQGKLIDTIVKKILRELKKAHLSVSKDLVGIGDQVEAIMEILAVEAPDVKFIGIWGMGGIGKTTLAKVLYNKILVDFDRCSFLQDVRETSTRSHNGLQQLQSQLVADLLRCDRPDIATIDEGTNVLRRRFREMKVLILLDDVDDVDQLKALAADVSWFGQGSRIIITTRYKDVLKVAQEHQVYEVKEMEEVQAFQLFCKHALRNDAPTIKMRALSEEIVKGTGCLPLALEVIGSFLHGKSEGTWKATSHKLKLLPNKKVDHKLRISYDALEHVQQQMFLDIACLFIGEDIKTVAYTWEDRYEFPPEADIEELRLLSLIKIGDDNRLRMHDQLQYLGRAIVREENYDEPGKRSRLWGNEALKVLQNNQGTKNIEGIRLEYQIGLEDCYFTPEKFRKLSKLRFLQLDCANLDGDFEDLLPELRWLRWKASSFNCTTRNLSLKNLLILDVSYSRITHNWDLWNSIQMMTLKLKVLDLSYCKELTTTPNLSTFRNLERLNLRECERLEVIDPSIGKIKLLELIVDGTRIKELPNLGGLKKLEILSARNCEFLTRIPSSVIHLTSLADLVLDQSKVSELPESIGFLVTLRRLTLVGTPLKELPESIGTLKLLVELGLSKTKVAILPDAIGNLGNLEVLRIDQSSVHCLPASLGRLKKLNKIDASGCQLLVEIPVELGSLSSLKVLLLRHTNITSIPETIRGLSCLETLDLAWCRQLRTLPDFPSSLSSMSVTCQSLVPIPNLPNLVNLRKLEVVRSVIPKEIFELPKLEKLHISRSKVSILPGEICVFPMLKELSISNASIQRLPELPPSLCKLSISRCHSLARLTELSNLQNLSELRIHSCPELAEIEGIGDLPSLRSLFVSFCARIDKLDGLVMPESLMYLHVEACENLEMLGNFSKLRELFCIIVSGCVKLVEVQGIGNMQTLQYLVIHDASIETLDDLPYLKSLRHLGFRHCSKLRGLDGIDELDGLKVLQVRECKSIEKLPDLSKLKLLEELVVDGCEKLQGLEGLEGLERVSELVISGCKVIESVPDLSNLKLLKHLRAENCEKLQGLEGLEKLGALKELNIRGCKSFEKLPDLSTLTCLEFLDADGCEKLQEAKKGLKILLKKLPDRQEAKWKQYVDANNFEKLKELDGLDELSKIGEFSYFQHESSFEKLPKKSNLRLLRQWYADGCEKVEELEGLENLEKFHLEFIPDLNLVKLSRTRLPTFSE